MRSLTVSLCELASVPQSADSQYHAVVFSEDNAPTLVMPEQLDTRPQQ